MFLKRNDISIYVEKENKKSCGIETHSPFTFIQQRSTNFFFLSERKGWLNVSVFCSAEKKN